MTNFFLLATQNCFPVILKLPNVFSDFFINCKSIFVLKQISSDNFFLLADLVFFVCIKVVLNTLVVFFSFPLQIFFQKR